MSLATRLLAAGGCYSDNTFQRCALQPLECPSPQVYRSSNWLLLNDNENAVICANQGSILKIPALGRCDSEAERFICTSHGSACRLDIAFSQMDSDCTVLADFRPFDTPFVRSYYGECVPTDEGTSAGAEAYCAWQFSECNNADGLYMFQPADKFLAAEMPSCQCDGVKTGACVDSGNSENFYCAVTPEVCSSESGFSYLKSYEVESTLNTTCKLCDSISPSPETRYTHAGACIVESTAEFRRCALIPEHCDGSGETFFSPKALERLNNEAASICKTQEGLHQVRVGRCISTSDQNVCVGDASGCTISQSFQQNDDQCQLVKDLDTAELSTTHFGHCSTGEDASFTGFQEGRENYCAWSFAECLDEDPNARPLNYGKALPGMSATVPTCHCDDVRVGACISDTNPTDSYCAVASSACDAGYSYANVRELEDPASHNKICFLCRPLPSDLTAPAPASSPVGVPQTPSPVAASPTSPPQTRPLPSPVTPPSRPSLPTYEKELENEGLAVGAVVGIILGALLTTFIFLVAICLVRIKGKQQTPGDKPLVDQVPERKQSRLEITDGEEGDEGELTPSNPTLAVLEQGQLEEDFIPQEDRSVN